MKDKKQVNLLLKLGDLIQYLNYDNKHLEVGYVYGFNTYRVFIVADFNGQARQRKLIPSQITRVLTSPIDINFLLTHSHQKLRKLGLRLLRKAKNEG